MGIYRSFGARVLKIVSETCGAGSLTEKASVDEVTVEIPSHSPTHLLTCSPTHLLAYSPTHLLTNSPTHYSPTHLFSPTRLLTYPPTGRLRATGIDTRARA